jgi:hypothetical protein
MILKNRSECIPFATQVLESLNDHSRMPRHTFGLSTKPERLKSLQMVPRYLALAMKTCVNDSQIHRAAHEIVKNFLRVNPEYPFSSVIPVLAIALQREMHVEVSCASLSMLRDQIGQLSASICRQLFNVLVVTDEKHDVAACLQTLAQNAGVERVICDQLSLIFGFIEGCENEELVLDLLRLVAQVNDAPLLGMFEPYMSHFIQLLGGHKVRIACAAAECLRVIAKQRPDLLAPYSEAVLRVLSRASAELLRLCLEIQKVMDSVGGW